MAYLHGTRQLAFPGDAVYRPVIEGGGLTAWTCISGKSLHRRAGAGQRQPLSSFELSTFRRQATLRTDSTSFPYRREQVESATVSPKAGTRTSTSKLFIVIGVLAT